MRDNRPIGNPDAGRVLCAAGAATLVKVVEEALTGDGRIFIAANLITAQNRAEFRRFLKSPKGVMVSTNVSEPLYLSLDAAMKGKNDDGSPHKGYLEIDARTARVVGAYDTEGNNITDEFRE